MAVWYFGDNMTSLMIMLFIVTGRRGHTLVGLEYCSHDLCDMVTRENHICRANPRSSRFREMIRPTIRFSSDAGDSLEYFWSFGDMTSSERLLPPTGMKTGRV